MNIPLLPRQLVSICLLLVLAVPRIVCDGHGDSTTCDKEATTCEFYLEVSSWLPMRKGYGQKVYVNETDGKLYVYGDQSQTPVDPDDIVLADGSDHDKVLTLFNRTMPGPTLTVYVDQEVVVHVTNHMLSDGVTVHWHGIEMRGTPWMDGAAFVTQCPILPGQTFTYRFRPNRSGTYFYHSHAGAQMNMGLLGGFIVKDKNMVNMEEHVLFIQDYNNMQESDAIWVGSGLLGSIKPDGTRVRPRKRSDNTSSALVQITSSLINGRGRVLDETGRHITKTPLSVFHVNKDINYRFRVIGGSYVYQYKLSIDGHMLKVVAADGNAIEPVIVDFIFIHSGERFDFVLEANENVGNFWIRAENFHDTKDLIGFAIIRYNGANEGDPESVTKNCTEDKSCTAMNCPFENFANWNCIPTDKIQAADSRTPAPSPSPRKFKEFFINVGLFRKTSGPVYGHMNGVSLKLPTVSALTQPKEVTGICEPHHDCQPDKACFCVRPLSVDFGDIVQITFISAGISYPVNHPIHIHGYSFHVLKVGYRGVNSSFTPDINCPTQLCYSNASWSNGTWYGGNLPDLDLTRAPRKDTVVLPPGGYVVVRFVADNPGLWFIHCHHEMHSNKGMGLLLNDSFPHVPKPPAGFPECRNYPVPDWNINLRTESSTIEATTKPDSPCSGTQMYCHDRVTCASFCNGEVECEGQEDENGCPVSETLEEERTFTEEEFWGMFSALMFVVLLQFVIAIACFSRGKEKASVNF